MSKASTREEFTVPDSVVFDQNREADFHRPCDCGCDQRGENAELVGYWNVVKDGKGTIIRFYDEEEFVTARAENALEGGFEYEGVWITDPSLDETGRFPVAPDYYKD